MNYYLVVVELNIASTGLTCNTAFYYKCEDFDLTELYDYVFANVNQTLDGQVYGATFLNRLPVTEKEYQINTEENNDKVGPHPNG